MTGKRRWLTFKLFLIMALVFTQLPWSFMGLDKVYAASGGNNPDQSGNHIYNLNSKRNPSGFQTNGDWFYGDQPLGKGSFTEGRLWNNTDIRQISAADAQAAGVDVVDGAQIYKITWNTGPTTTDPDYRQEAYNGDNRYGFFLPETLQLVGDMKLDMRGTDINTSSGRQTVTKSVKINPNYYKGDFGDTMNITDSNGNYQKINKYYVQNYSAYREGNKLKTSGFNIFSEYMTEWSNVKYGINTLTRATSNNDWYWEDQRGAWFLDRFNKVYYLEMDSTYHGPKEILAVSMTAYIQVKPDETNTNSDPNRVMGSFYKSYDWNERWSVVRPIYVKNDYWSQIREQLNIKVNNTSSQDFANQKVKIYLENESGNEVFYTRDIKSLWNYSTQNNLYNYYVSDPDGSRFAEDKQTTRFKKFRLVVGGNEVEDGSIVAMPNASGATRYVKVEYKTPTLDTANIYDNTRKEANKFSFIPSESELKLTDVTDLDTDGDGIKDWQEVTIFKSNPNAKDTDGDGKPDMAIPPINNPSNDSHYNSGDLMNLNPITSVGDDFGSWQPGSGFTVYSGTDPIFKAPFTTAVGKKGEIVYGKALPYSRVSFRAWPDSTRYPYGVLLGETLADKDGYFRLEIGNEIIRGSSVNQWGNKLSLKTAEDGTITPNYRTSTFWANNPTFKVPTGSWTALEVNTWGMDGRRLYFDQVSKSSKQSVATEAEKFPDVDDDTPVEPSQNDNGAVVVEKTPVSDLSNLTDDEKAQVKAKVVAAYKDYAPLTEDMITVNADGSGYITFSDNSKITFRQVDTVIQGPNGHDVIRDINGAVPVAKDFVKGAETFEGISGYSDVTYSFSPENTVLSTATAGETPVNVTVSWKYNNKTYTKTLSQKLTVQQNASERLEPTAPENKIPVKDPSALSTDEKTAVANAVSEANSDISSEFAEDKQAGETANGIKVADNGDVTIRYSDGTEDNIYGTVIQAGEPKTVTYHVGDSLTDSQAKNSIANKSTDTVDGAGLTAGGYKRLPVGTFTWKTKPALTTAGEEDAVVHFVSTDGTNVQDIPVKVNVIQWDKDKYSITAPAKTAAVNVSSISSSAGNDEVSAIKGKFETANNLTEKHISGYELNSNGGSITVTFEDGSTSVVSGEDVVYQLAKGLSKPMKYKENPTDEDLPDPKSLIANLTSNYTLGTVTYGPISDSADNVQVEYADKEAAKRALSTSGLNTVMLTLTDSKGNVQQVEAYFNVSESIASGYTPAAPERTPVENPDSLSDDDKAAIVEKIKEANSNADISNIKVIDKDTYEITYGDGSSETIDGVPLTMVKAVPKQGTEVPMGTSLPPASDLIANKSTDDYAGTKLPAGASFEYVDEDSIDISTKGEKTVKVKVTTTEGEQIVDVPITVVDSKASSATINYDDAYTKVNHYGGTLTPSEKETIGSNFVTANEDLDYAEGGDSVVVDDSGNVTVNFDDGSSLTVPYDKITYQNAVPRATVRLIHDVDEMPTPTALLTNYAGAADGNNKLPDSYSYRFKEEPTYPENPDTLSLIVVYVDQNNKEHEANVNVSFFPNNAENFGYSQIERLPVGKYGALTPEEKRILVERVKAGNTDSTIDTVVSDDAGNITFTFKDGSQKVIPYEQNTYQKAFAVTEPVELDWGSTPSVDDAKSGIANNSDSTTAAEGTKLPASSQFVWGSVPVTNGPDSDDVVYYNVTVTNTQTIGGSQFTDVQTVSVPVKIRPSLSKTTTLTMPDKYPVIDTENITDDEKDQVAQKLYEANKDNNVTSVTATGDDETYDDFVTITYSDGSKKTIPFADLVVQKAIGGEVTVSKNHVMNENDAKQAIANSSSDIEDGAKKLPDNAEYKFLSPTTAPSYSTLDGYIDGKVEVKIGDSVQVVPVRVKVRPTSADQNDPDGGIIRVPVGTELTNKHAEEAISNRNELSDVSGYSWKESVDTDISLGDNEDSRTLDGTVRVAYTDSNSSIETTYDDVPVKVVVVKHSAYYSPVGQTVKTKKGNVPEASSAIQNMSDLPKGTTVAWKNPADVETAVATKGLKTGNVLTVTYPDNSSEEISVDIYVTSDAEDFDPQGGTVTFKKGSYNDEQMREAAKTAISNNSQAPSGATYEFVDATYEGKAYSVPNTLSDASNADALVKITYDDDSFEYVPVKYDVVGENNPVGGTIVTSYDRQLTSGDAKSAIKNATSLTGNPEFEFVSTPEWNDKYTPGVYDAVVYVNNHDNIDTNVDVKVVVMPAKPTAKPVVYNIGDAVKSDEAYLKSLITNLNDVHVDGATYSWETAPTTEGAKSANAVIKIVYPEDYGTYSTVIVPYTVNPRNVQNNPVGGTIYKNKGEELTAADAEKAISNASDLVGAVKYSWDGTDPNSFVAGPNEGTVKIVYDDDTYDTVKVTVVIPSDKKTYEPVVQKVIRDHGNLLNATNPEDKAIMDQIASDAVKSFTENGEPIEKDQAPVSKYELVESSVDLTKGGTVSLNVKVTYQDGSFDTKEFSLEVPGYDTMYNPIGDDITMDGLKKIEVDDSDFIEKANIRPGVDDENQNFPNGTSIKLSEPFNPTESGTYDVTFIISYPDGTSDELTKKVTVTSHKDLEGNLPKGHDISVGNGPYIPKDSDEAEKIAKEILTNEDELKEVKDYQLTEDFDSSVRGEHNVTVKVIYNDGTFDEVPAIVTVRDMKDDFEPIGENITIDKSPEMIYKDSEKAQEIAKEAILNDADDEEIPDGSTRLPEGTKFYLTEDLDPTKPGERDITIRVVYSDGTEETVTVKADIKGYDDIVEPVVKDVTVPQGNVIKAGSEEGRKLAEEAIQNENEFPEGTTYNIKDSVDTSKPGDYKTTVIINYPDGTKAEKEVTIHVPKPVIPNRGGNGGSGNGGGSNSGGSNSGGTIGGNVGNTSGTDGNAQGGDTDVKPIAGTVDVQKGTKVTDDDARKAISNADQLPEGTEFRFKTPIDSSKLGEQEAVVVVTYPDGTTEEVKVKVNITEDGSKAKDEGTDDSERGRDWGLLTLIFAILSILLAIVALLSRKKDGEKKPVTGKVIAVIGAICAIVILFLEDFSGSMVMIDKLTIPAAITTVVAIVGMVLTSKKSSSEE